MKARYKECCSSTVVIDDTEIPWGVFGNEIVDWKLEERDDYVFNLINWIADADYGTANHRMMLDDLILINNSNDEVFWSSIHTNKFIFRSEDPEQFDEICKEVLEAGKKLEE